MNRLETVLEHAECTSPVGPIFLFARNGRLCALSLGHSRDRAVREIERRFGPTELHQVADPAGAVSALNRYWAGDLRALDGIEVDPGGTPFQQRVWKALRTIPVGTVVSYSTLARSIGSPTAVRAVGAANGANPVAIVIPCHRVIGADGSLTGYGGGLPLKRWLLAHEGAPLAAPGSPQQRLEFR
jgi:methylated-DNA-[protein]-cysteine S-methyltransferase